MNIIMRKEIYLKCGECLVIVYCNNVVVFLKCVKK